MSNVIILAIICCVTIILCKLIQTWAYKSALQDEHDFYRGVVRGEGKNKKTNSPYSLERVRHTRSGAWGYAITKNGKKVTHDGTYQILDLNSAKELMWEFEDIAGYERTQL